MPAVYFLISMSSRYTMPVLHNRISNETLKAQMLAETEPRTTISFYKYFTIVDPQATRDALWVALTQLKVFGRIYLAREGINAQISVPQSNVEALREFLYGFDPALAGLPIHFYALYAALRLCGTEPTESFVFDKRIGQNRRYANLSLKTAKTAACLEIGEGVQLHCGLTILGESGQITVPDDWWNTSYFEMTRYGDNTKKRYCYNYDGNGMRYILRELLIMLRENRTQSHRFPHEESIRLTEMYSRLMNQEEVPS